MREKPAPSNQAAVLDALLRANSELNVKAKNDSCLRSINFMVYELSSLCSDKSENDRLNILNTFFFETKKFKICDHEILIEPILENRRARGIALSLLYIHLAKQIELHLELIQWPLHTLIKWDSAAGSRFIDLAESGRFLSEEQILAFINKHKEPIDTLNSMQSQIQYFSYLLFESRQNDNLEEAHKILNLLLQLEPENTRYIAERALLRRDLGLHKEALQDLKRYFSFANSSCIPTELVKTYETLQTLV